MAENSRMPWFKWWDGTCSDMKLRMLADELKVPAGIVIAVWAYHMELASRSAERGSVGLLDAQALRQMAYTLQFDIATIETVCNGLKRDGLVTETGEIAKWEIRQAKREKSEPAGASTKRVQALRERQKAAKNKDLGGGNGGNANVTDETDETAGNAVKHPKKKNKNKEEEEDGEGQQQPPSPPVEPAIQLACHLRKQNVMVQFTHPAVLDWVRDGVPVEILDAAVRTARETLGDTARIQGNYLVPIVRDILHPPERRAANGVPPTGGERRLNQQEQREANNRAIAEKMIRERGLDNINDDEGEAA